jgi:hypothetical protein
MRIAHQKSPGSKTLGETFLRWTRNGGFSGSQGTPTVDVTRGHCPQHLGYGFPAWNLPGIYFSSMITGKKCDIP